MSGKYGSDWLNASDQHGFLVRKAIREHVENRSKANPGRFPKKIDALTLEQEVELICKPKLYKSHFDVVFAKDFPLGHELVKFYLSAIIPIRNKVFHFNPVSHSEELRLQCYSGEIINTIKSFFIKENMAKIYNVPEVIEFRDSLGNYVTASEFGKIAQTRYIKDLKSNVLFPGDDLYLNVLIDPSFEDEGYDVQWRYTPTGKKSDTVFRDGQKFKLAIIEQNIRESFRFTCRITSKKSWHRFGTYDDEISVSYEIRPMPES